jgi:hypothetical protein
VASWQERTTAAVAELLTTSEETMPSKEKATKKKPKRTRGRSSKSGKFITKAEVRRHPDTTETERVK